MWPMADTCISWVAAPISNSGHHDSDIFVEPLGISFYHRPSQPPPGGGSHPKICRAPEEDIENRTIHLLVGGFNPFEKY